MSKVPKYQWLLLLVLLGACIGIAKQYEVDIKTVYAVASVKNVAESYVQQGNDAGRYFYGPFSLILLRPLGFLSFVQAKWVWIGLQVFCFFVFFHFLYRFFPEIKESFVLWLLVFIFAINPVHNNFQSNNIQLMLMAALMYAEVLSEEEGKKPFFAGVIVSLLASIKIFPAFIGLYYFLTKQKAVKAGLIAGALFALLSPFFFFGIETTLRFYHDFRVNVSSYQADNELSRPDILSLASWVNTLTANQIFFGKESLATALFIGISLLFFLVAWAVKENKAVSFSVWALGLLLMAVLTPSARVHFWVFAVPAFAVLALNFVQKKQWDQPKGILFLLSLGMMCLTTQAILGKEWNDSLEQIRIPLLGLFILGGILLGEIFREGFKRPEIKAKEIC